MHPTLLRIPGPRLVRPGVMAVARRHGGGPPGRHGGGPPGRHCGGPPGRHGGGPPGRHCGAPLVMVSRSGCEVGGVSLLGPDDLMNVWPSGVRMPRLAGIRPCHGPEPGAICRVWPAYVPVVGELGAACRVWPANILYSSAVLQTRVKAHVLICMLAPYLAWHLRQAWAPLTFTDGNRPDPADPVPPARAPKAPTTRPRPRPPPTTYPHTASPLCRSTSPP